MNKLTIIVLSLVFAILFPAYVNAAGNCQPIYGGGESCLSQDKITVDKKIQSPVSKKFVDNLTQSETKFAAGDNITFELNITNKSGNTLKEIEVIDNLPNNLTYTSGPGSYNTKTRTLSFKINDLKANESRKFIVVGMVNNVGKSTCVINYASVKSGNLKADDNSRFCLEKSICVDTPNTTKGGFPVMPAPQGMTQTPATGPEMIPLFSLLPLALAGLYIRKKV